MSARSKEREVREVVCSVLYVEVTNAEHTEANLLPCNAAGPVASPGECGEAMSPVTEFDQRLEQIIREFALRIAVPQWTEFDTVWEAAIRVCDRYELGEGRRPDLVANERGIDNIDNKERI